MGFKWVLAALLLFASEAAVSLPMQIVHQGETIATVHKEDYIRPFPGIPLVDEDKLEALADEAARRVERAPVDATLNGAGAIVPERPGLKLDRRAFRTQLYGFAYEGEPSVLEAPTRLVYPRVDSEILASIKMNVIGYYTTYFNSRNRNRSSNIALAAQALNNTVVFPGERFSFNGTVGKRTREKGYLRAPVIVRGEMYEDIGGGICQVSSTLYNAVDRAGLTIVERYSHSRNVHYVPPGRDATVSWYGPDFVFLNPYNHPVLIRALVSGGQVAVSVHSSDMLETQPRQVPNASTKLPQEENRDERKAGAQP